MKKLINVAKILLGWPFAAIALIFIGKLFLSNSTLIVKDVKNINFVLLASGIIAFLFYFLMRVYLWKNILKEQGHKIPLKETAFFWELSEVKRYIPGNIWSFLGRAASFSSFGISTKAILKSIVIEIKFLLLGSLGVSIFSVGFVLNFIGINNSNKQLIAFIAAVFIGLIILFFIFLKSIAKKILLKRFPFVERFIPSFSPTVNFRLFIISFCGMFFFGLGSYLSAVSVFYLSPVLILGFIGFFVLAFLIGYLSIVAPMGLGVREGVITFGLSKITSLSSAGFVAIYTRIVLILSETIFFLMVFCWAKIKSRFIPILQGFLKSHKQIIILTLLVIAYVAYFTFASFLRHDNFYTGRFDLGNMDQTVWNTFRGRVFQLTDPNGTDIISRLGFHADFFLILLSPFYYIWSDPKMLLLIQTIIVALGAYFVYGISKDLIKSRNLSLAFSVAFLFNPSLQFANLYDFHPVTLATTFLLGAFYFLKRNALLFILFLVLAGTTKEQIWLVNGFLGFYFALFYFRKKVIKKTIVGAIITLFSVSIFYYLIWYAIPSFSLDKKHFALSFYSDFGDSTTSVVKNILFSPVKTFGTILQKGQLIFLKDLFLPVGFLSLLSPLYLVFALPDLLIDLLSKNTQLHQIYYQYTASITPFLFISAIFGVKFVLKKFSKISEYILMFYILLAAFGSAYWFGPLPGSLHPNIDMFTKPQENREFINKFLSNVPKRLSIAATNNIGAHISHRQLIFTIPVGIDKADMVIFLLNDKFAQPSLEKQRQMVKTLEKDKNYKEILKLGDFVAFRKANLPLWNMNFRRRVFF